MHYGRVDRTTDSLKFPLSRPCKAGEQCYLSYGNLSSAHLITFYGFFPKGDNPYDVIPLGINYFPAQLVLAYFLFTYFVWQTAQNGTELFELFLIKGLR